MIKEIYKNYKKLKNATLSVLLDISSIGNRELKETIHSI